MMTCVAGSISNTACKSFHGIGQNDIMQTQSDEMGPRNGRLPVLPLGPAAAGWQLVNLDEPPSPPEPERPVPRRDSRQHQEGKPIDPSAGISIGISRELGPEDHQALQNVAKAQRLGNTTAKSSVVDMPYFEQDPPDGKAEASVQPQRLVGRMAVCSCGRNSGEEKDAVWSEGEKEAGYYREGGVDAEEGVQRAPAADLGGGRGGHGRGESGVKNEGRRKEASASRRNQRFKLLYTQ